MEASNQTKNGYSAFLGDELASTCFGSVLAPERPEVTNRYMKSLERYRHVITLGRRARDVGVTTKKIDYGVMHEPKP